MANITAPSPEIPKRWLTRGVLGLGLGSLFSDWGHETATAILPAFLASIGAPPVALGIIEGVAEGINSVLKVISGYLSDRRERGPYGLAGGSAGKPGKNTRLRGGRAIPLKAKTRFDIKAGEVLRIESPGGGGWGKPEARLGS